MMMIPIYIPTRKITIMAPKVMQKIAFLLNYKGLHTTSITAPGDFATIKFSSFEKIRKCLARWQKRKSPHDAALWEWFKEKVTIELRLDDVDETEDDVRIRNPYLVWIHFPVAYSDHFARLFKAAMM